MGAIAQTPSHQRDGRGSGSFVTGFDQGVSSLHPDYQEIFLSCVLEKQKGMPALLKTTLNATYTVPIGTLSQGNERMTRIQVLCGLSQWQWAV